MTTELNPSTTSAPSAVSSNLVLDGQGLKDLLSAGLAWLKTNQQIVNALNVFPVPDGDTGTNMLLTMQAAYNEIANLKETRVGKVGHAISQGALMGARGNSGVILSQLWRGFARELDNLETMDAELFVRALGEARNTAYKGVVRPVEGTILTVAKDVAAAGEAALLETKDLHLILEKLVQAADASVQHTPELLPILKQAGVVDSGGKGLFFILEGMLRHLNHQSLESPLMPVQSLSAINMDDTMETIEPGQDLEWVIDFEPKQPLELERFYNALTDIGTSIQLGEGDGMYRLHIHVANEARYKAYEYVESIGTIIKGTFENLVYQLNQKESDQLPNFNLAAVEPGTIAVIAVSPGAGISRIFASLGVNAIVEGGQTMNPSTEEILRCVENLPTDQVIILPNNKNIVMAAQNAASMTTKKVRVIHSVSVPQGLSAMLRCMPDGHLDKVAEDMKSALQDVESGEVTTATRSVEINGIEVREGEVIALLNGKLVLSSQNLSEAIFGLLEKANTADRERITLFYGADIAKDEVNRIADQIRQQYPAHEIEIHEGRQPHYQFIIAIE